MTESSKDSRYNQWLRIDNPVLRATRLKTDSRNSLNNCKKHPPNMFVKRLNIRSFSLNALLEKN